MFGKDIDAILEVIGEEGRLGLETDQYTVLGNCIPEILKTCEKSEEQLKKLFQEIHSILKKNDKNRGSKEYNEDTVLIIKQASFQKDQLQMSSTLRPISIRKLENKKETRLGEITENCERILRELGYL